MRCTSRWLLPVTLAVPSVLLGQQIQPAARGDCSLSRPLAHAAIASTMSAPSADLRAVRLADVSRRRTPAFHYAKAWAAPVFAPPARPRGNTLPRFLARNPLLSRPLIRKLVNQVAGRELFDPSSAGPRRISIAPHVDPGSEQYGVRVRLSLSRPD